MKKVILSIFVMAISFAPLFAEEANAGKTYKFIPKNANGIAVINIQKVMKSEFLKTIDTAMKPLSQGKSFIKEANNELAKSLGIKTDDLIEMSAFAMDANGEKEDDTPPFGAILQVKKFDVGVVVAALKKDAEDVVESKYNGKVYYHQKNNKDDGYIYVDSEFLMMAKDEKTLKLMLDTGAGNENILNNDKMGALVKGYKNCAIFGGGYMTENLKKLVKKAAQKGGVENMKSIGFGVDMDKSLTVDSKVEYNKKESADKALTKFNEEKAKVAPMAAMMPAVGKVLTNMKAEAKETTFSFKMEITAAALKEAAQMLPMLLMGLSGAGGGMAPPPGPMPLELD